MTAPTTRRALARLLLAVGLLLAPSSAASSPSHALHGGTTVHAVTASDSLPVRVERHRAGELPPVHQLAAVLPAQALVLAPADSGAAVLTAARPAYGGVLARAGRGPPGA